MGSHMRHVQGPAEERHSPAAIHPSRGVVEFAVSARMVEPPSNGDEALAAAAAVAVPVLVVVVTVALAALRRKGVELPGNESGHRAVGIAFGADQSANAPARQPACQAATHPAGDENVDGVQRMRAVAVAFVERLLLRKLKQRPRNDLIPLDIVDPEVPAHAGVSVYRLAILARDCNFHGVLLDR
jgi:hypothetical protein